MLEAQRCARRGAQVYVSAGKLRVLQALGLPQEYTQLLTADDKVPRQSGRGRMAVHDSMGVGQCVMCAARVPAKRGACQGTWHMSYLA